MDNAVGSLTQLQKSLIAGSILGDGYIRIAPGRKDAFLEINHSYQAKEYVDWKYVVLKNIAGSRPKMREGNGNRIAYRFYTRQHPEITELFRQFYVDKKKTVPAGLILDPIMMAVWFMDDGSRCRSSDVYFNTQQFSYEEQQRLIKNLQQFDIEARVNRDKEYLRLRILKSSLPKFRSLIREHIVPSMRYKIEL